MRVGTAVALSSVAKYWVLTNLFPGPIPQVSVYGLHPPRVSILEIVLSVVGALCFWTDGQSDKRHLYFLPVVSNINHDYTINL